MLANVRSLYVLFVSASSWLAACGSGGPVDLSGGSSSISIPGGGTSGTTVPEAGTMVTKTITVNGATSKYRVFVPKAYTTAKKWPIIVGIGGFDANGQPSAGLPIYVGNNLATFPAIVVMPWTYPPVEGLTGFALKVSITQAELDETIRTYSVDPTRQYATGISTGGTQIYQMAYQDPTRFAAIVPVSGTPSDAAIMGQPTAAPESSYPLVAQRLKDLPTWVFHGSADPSASVARARDLVQAFRNVGANIQYTEIPGGAHNGSTWDVTYATPALYTWLLAQHR